MAILNPIPAHRKLLLTSSWWYNQIPNSFPLKRKTFLLNVQKIKRKTFPQNVQKNLIMFPEVWLTGLAVPMVPHLLKLTFCAVFVTFLNSLILIPV